MSGHGEGERRALGQVLDSSRSLGMTWKECVGVREAPPIPLLRPFDPAYATAHLRQGERNTPLLGMERPYFVSRFRGGNGEDGCWQRWGERFANRPYGDWSSLSGNGLQGVDQEKRGMTSSPKS